jgi:hypothetical protein
MLDRVVSWVHLVGSVRLETQRHLVGKRHVTKKDAPLSWYVSRVHLVGCVQYTTSADCQRCSLLHVSGSCILLR